MPTLKNILTRQAAIPANIEVSLPILPKMSGMLAQLAATVPFNPELPDLPVGMETAMPFAAGINQVIKGVEDALPAGIPKVSDTLMALGMGGYRPVAVEEKKTNNHGRVMGSGYRSI